jgi:hypothetical protein
MVCPASLRGHTTRGLLLGGVMPLWLSAGLADRNVAPDKGSGAGLRPGPFPGQAASPLPGFLAATRTGLPPAGDDELANTKINRGLTSR